MSEFEKFRIIDILHSGLKGERGSPVTQSKYEGMLGAIVWIDKTCVYLDRPAHIIFENHPTYEWWDTSNVIAISETENFFGIETLNSIYVLLKININAN